VSWVDRLVLLVTSGALAGEVYGVAVEGFQVFEEVAEAGDRQAGGVVFAAVPGSMPLSLESLMESFPQVRTSLEPLILAALVPGLCVSRACRGGDGVGSWGYWHGVVNLVRPSAAGMIGGAISVGEGLGWNEVTGLTTAA
jgi:hypothetical protein